MLITPVLCHCSVRVPKTSKSVITLLRFRLLAINLLLLSGLPFKTGFQRLLINVNCDHLFVFLTATLNTL